MKKKLVVVAHPQIEKSVFNKSLLEKIKDLPDLTIHYLYSSYPNFNIDVEKEQKLLVSHDVLIFQHPFYWYSCPPLFKLWIEKVLAYGFAYGEGGNALQGKEWTSVITTGGRGTNYCSGGPANFTISELMRPIQQTVLYCGMIWKPVFAVSGALEMKTETEKKEVLDVAGIKYREMLSSM